MIKKALIALPVLVVIVMLGLFFWVRSVLMQDSVRAALATQLSRAIGQPVRIGSLGATIFPRVTVILHDVSVGDPSRVQIRALNLGASFGALFRRRIEQANVLLEGARIDLPLPELAIGRSSSTGADGQAVPSAAPVEIVSIDDILLRDVEIVSGGRTLRGDVDLAWEGHSLAVRRISLMAEGLTIDATGHITDLSGPVGELTVKAGALDFNQLMAFATDFSRDAGLAATNAAAGTGPPANRPADGAAMNLAIALEADRATLGTLAVEQLEGRVRVTDEAITLEPITFGVFGGRYEGVLALALGDTPAFDLKAGLSAVDMATATAFAGRPGAMTGHLSGRIELSGRGLNAADVIDSAHGTLRVDVVDGLVRGLALIRAVVAATSMRAAGGLVAAAAGRLDEPFSRLGATLTIADGTARTADLRFESEDLTLTTDGSVALDGSAVNLRGQIQLSERLTREAGTELTRYTEQGGRVTLPVTVNGSVGNLSVRIDVSDMARRALRNRANEETQKAIQRGLGALFR